MSNPIPAENLNTGTTAWQPANLATTQIAAYADKHSVDAGGSVNFFVSTQSAGTTWTAVIYRLGWYYGSGARQVASITTQTGVAQGYWDGSTLQSCPTAIIDSSTHNLEAGWSSSYTYNVPGGAVTGIYLALFTDQNGKTCYLSFVVRGNRPADFVYIRPTTTDAAYNTWGGYSLYTSPTVGVKVSFNRPDANGGGTGGLLQLEIAAIKWLESQGYNLSYLTMQDIHENPSWLQQYSAVIFGGHNEYWTKEIRDGVQSALSSGVGLAFFGANAAYWQCRFNADAASNIDRAITCYKVTTAAANLSTDPLYGSDPAHVTSQFRDASINRPEAALCGIQFKDLVTGPTKVPWTVYASAPSKYLAGTNMLAGSSYGADLVGDEFDNQVASSPANLQIIGQTSVTNSHSNPDTQHTTYYTAPSGALVFAAGSHALTFGLDSYRWSAAGTPYVLPGLRVLFSHIMTDLLKGKAASSAPSGLSGFNSFHT